MGSYYVIGRYNVIGCYTPERDHDSIEKVNGGMWLDEAIRSTYISQAQVGSWNGHNSPRLGKKHGLLLTKNKIDVCNQQNHYSWLSVKCFLFVGL